MTDWAIRTCRNFNQLKRYRKQLMTKLAIARLTGATERICRHKIQLVDDRHVKFFGSKPDSP